MESNRGSTVTSPVRTGREALALRMKGIVAERFPRYLALRRDGMSDKQIAAECGVSHFTVMNVFAVARAAGHEVPMKQRYTRGSLAERFADHVNKDGPIHPTLGQCWLWIGASKRIGYGAITDTRGEIGKAGLRARAHRCSYALHHGIRLDPGMATVILHKCDNPSCVRPEHLELGTQKENIHDALAKGRMRWQGGVNDEASLRRRAHDAEHRRRKRTRKAHEAGA